MSEQIERLTTQERVMIVFTIITVISTFLPWLSVSALWITLTETGIETNLVIIIIITGVVATTIIFFAKSHILKKVVTLITGIISVAICGLNVLQISNDIATYESEYASLISYNIEFGLIICVVAGLGLIVLSLIKDKQALEESP